MLYDDTIECFYSVFRSQENDTEISVQEPEYSFVDFYSLYSVLKFALICS